jgi:hypothetical protein
MKPEPLLTAQCLESPNNNNRELPSLQDGGSNNNNNNPQQPHLVMSLSVIDETEIVTSSEVSGPITMTSSRLVLNCPIDEEVIGTPTNSDTPVFGASKPRVVMTLGSDDEDEVSSDANVAQGGSQSLLQKVRPF